MANDIYMTAIDAIVDVMIKNDRLEENQEYYESHGNELAAEKLYRSIYRNINKIWGMQEMLSMMAGIDYEEVCSDIHDRYTERTDAE